jgi:P22 coat protein - gene protein 5
MANQFLNAQEYANTMLMLAKNQLVTGKLVTGKFKNEVSDENGLTISVKRPPRFARNDASALSAALAAQDIVTGSVPVTVDQYAKVHVSVGDIEYVQSFNELMKNETMKSAASTLAHQIDAHLQRQVAKFSSYAGGTGTFNTDPGNFIGSPAEFNKVHTRLMDLGAPNSDLCSTVLFNDGEEIRGSLIGGDIQGINKSALERARIPLLSEIDVYATQQCPSITNGTRVPLATTAIDNGTLSVNYRDVKTTMVQTIHVDGQASGVTINVGEKFTIAGVFAYDWRNQTTLPYLQVFTVVGGASTASGSVPNGSALNTPITTDAGGDVDLIISPPIIVPNTNDGVSTAANTAFATCSAAPVDGAAVTHLGALSTTRRFRAAWHKSAITLVSAKLQTPFTGESSFATDPETGISIRYWRGSDISTGAHVHRWDCLYGAQNLDPLMGSEISGA